MTYCVGWGVKLYSLTHSLTHSLEVIGTPKRHFLARYDVFWLILRRNPFRGVRCSVSYWSIKKQTKIFTFRTWQNHVFKEQKALTRSLQNLACRVLFIMASIFQHFSHYASQLLYFWCIYLDLHAWII